MREVLISLKKENLNKIDYKKKYQRTWLQIRRSQWIKENGPCKVCGSWKDLQIDHIDPSKKKIRIATIWSRKKQIRDKELAKCQVLCKTHHIEKTSKENSLAGHGTKKMYKVKKCRCASCLSAKKKALVKS